MKIIEVFFVLTFFSCFLRCTTSDKFYTNNEDLKVDVNDSDSSALLKLSDGLRITKIKSGFYYRKTPINIDDQESIFSNEINWIYISSEFLITYFTTSNDEGCYVSELHQLYSPKRIYRKLRRNFDIIEKLTFGYCRTSDLIPNKKR